MPLPPWTFLVVAIAGWIRRHQEAALEYLREENRVLREQLGPAPTAESLRRRAGFKHLP
jgi:hypothetical protein